MKRLTVTLLTLLACGVGAGQKADGGQAVAHAGQTATLNVVFGLRDLLLSRDAPNSLRLVTPWGEVAGKIGGTTHPDAHYSGYYGSMRPLALRVAVPAGTRSGVYPAKLSARLFTCEQKRGLCAQRDVNVAVSIQVLVPGAVATARPLRLTDGLIAPTHPGFLH